MDNIETLFDNLLDAYYTEIENIEDHIVYLLGQTKKMESQGKWRSADIMDGYRIQAENDLKKTKKIIAELERIRAIV